MRDDAAGAFFRRERGDLVIGAADLERADALEILRLETDPVAGELVERPRRKEGGGMDDPRKEFRRRFNIAERDHAGYGVRTILPKCSRSSMRRCASAAAASGMTESTTGWSLRRSFPPSKNCSTSVSSCLRPIHDPRSARWRVKR